MRNGAFDEGGRERQGDPTTQESRPLFGFKQGKGCKTRQGSKAEGGTADSLEGSPRWRTHTEGARKVHECKFYDQSGGLIQAVMRRRAYNENEGEREREIYHSRKYPDWRNTNDALIGID